MTLAPQANPNVVYSFTITFAGKSGDFKSNKRRSKNLLLQRVISDLLENQIIIASITEKY